MRLFIQSVVICFIITAGFGLLCLFAFDLDIKIGMPVFMGFAVIIGLTAGSVARRIGTSPHTSQLKSGPHKTREDL